MSYKVAVFSLNQWSLDFQGNTERILDSIGRAKDAGAIYRTGPELELSGYSVEDGFYEGDTPLYCWKCVATIIERTTDLNMIIDIGMPVLFGSLYNCRIFLYKGKVLCIRAKTSLAKDGVYREFRHFEPWPIDAGVVSYELPSILTGGAKVFVPFGADFVLEVDINGATPLRIGWDICQELWDVKNVSSDLYHNFGCHLVVNSSGSYWELRKLEVVNDMIRGLTVRSGACYAFSNFVGCDGQRTVFFGRSCIYENGRLVAITPSLTVELFEEIQMITHDIDPVTIETNRALLCIRPSLARSARRWDLRSESRETSQMSNNYKIFYLKLDNTLPVVKPISKALSLDLSPKVRFEDEIHYFAPLWLWDYLRRSGMRGFMMPLSGGLDSSTVALLVYSMCNHIHRLMDLQSVADFFVERHKIPRAELPSILKEPKDICKLILKCCYIATKYSSKDTQKRAEKLCEAIGAHFQFISIQETYDQLRQNCSRGSNGPDEVTLLEQNLQARLRMTVTYLCSEGSRIVLATGNVDEAIMGYLTKYDCSSADINPIGGLCKNDLKSYVEYCRQHVFQSQTTLVEALGEIVSAPPSAELTGADQRDEDEIGITYDEISVLGKVRRGAYGCSGPRRAFETIWKNRHSTPFSTNIRCLKNSTGRDSGEVAVELAELVKRFYRRYTTNRHKLTVLTPALHAETYSPDDNRFDHRQILFPQLNLQFKCLDELVNDIKLGVDRSML